MPANALPKTDAGFPMSNHDEIYELMERAEDLSDETAKVALLDEAVRLADADQDLDLQFGTRMMLISSCFMGGHPEKMLVAISWCLGSFDRSGDSLSNVDYEVVLWQCKHAISYAPRFLQISYDQFNELLTDVLDRYEKSGISPRSVYMIACSSEMFMGHFDKATEYRHLLRQSPIDHFYEGKAWELCIDVEYLSETGQQDEALSRLEPMLENPALAEEVYPWFAHFAMMQLTQKGRVDEALQCQRRAYRMTANNPKFIDNLGQQIIFLAHIKKFPQAIKIFERHLPLAMQTLTYGARFFFYLASWFMLKRLAAAGRSELPLHLPAELQPLGIDDVYQTEALIDWFHEGFHDLELKFNQRNGNDYFSKIVKRTDEL
jgi:tetratricopeptide (TPR) repeat protein